MSCGTIGNADFREPRDREDGSGSYEMFPGSTHLEDNDFFVTVMCPVHPARVLKALDIPRDKAMIYEQVHFLKKEANEPDITASNKEPPAYVIPKTKNVDLRGVFIKHLDQERAEAEADFDDDNPHLNM